jgi:hypothetical protein
MASSPWARDRDLHHAGGRPIDSGPAVRLTGSGLHDLIRAGETYLVRQPTG